MIHNTLLAGCLMLGALFASLLAALTTDEFASSERLFIVFVKYSIAATAILYFLTIAFNIVSHTVASSEPKQIYPNKQDANLTITYSYDNGGALRTDIVKESLDLRGLRYKDIIDSGLFQASNNQVKLTASTDKSKQTIDVTIDQDSLSNPSKDPDATVSKVEKIENTVEYPEFFGTRTEKETYLKIYFAKEKSKEQKELDDVLK